MKFILIFATLLVGLCGAVRRARTTTSTESTAATFESRQLGFAGQPEELESLWDHIDIQKLDGKADSTKTTSTANATELRGSSESVARQFYPGFPNNPGDSNELPSPISPTIAPIPSPAPGCLALRGQFPSPTSCANYLNCWDDVVIEQTCPNGLLFNDLTGFCDFDYNVNCGSRPLPTPKPPLPPGSKICPDLNGRYRSSTNCSEFYVCVVGRPIKFSCPRRLVYNDILNVCDYPYNVDCKGSATPKPLPPTALPPQQPTGSPQQPTYLPQQSTQSPIRPTYPPSRPTYPPQQPSYPSQQPSYPPQQPSYPSQQPSYPSQQPSYPPQQPSYPPQQPSYPSNPWLGKQEPDAWHQRPVASQAEIDKMQQQEEQNNEETFGEVDEASKPTISNPWNTIQAIPASLSKVPCENGDIHRLNDACTSVVVCRDRRPQLVQCPSGLTYDKPSDSCRPFSIAKC